jgi:non-heme chloroperoxidase
VTPSVRSVELPNGVRLQYVEQGASSGVPVLLLHGLSDSWRSFERVLAHLPEPIRGFALTQRGHGDASRPETGYRTGDFAEDVAAFMDAVHLDKAVIAGHSSHSLVAQRFAIDHPERTLGLVLVGAPATMNDRPGVQEMLDLLAKLTDPIDPDFVRGFVASTVAREVPKTFYEAMVEECLKVPARVWRATFEGMLTDDLSEERQGIKAPALLFWGDQGGVCTLDDQETLVAELAQAELLVYEGTGHTPHWEEPERFASDIAAFAERLAR